MPSFEFMLNDRGDLHLRVFYEKKQTSETFTLSLPYFENNEQDEESLPFLVTTMLGYEAGSYLVGAKSGQITLWRPSGKEDEKK